MQGVWMVFVKKKDKDVLYAAEPFEKWLMT